MKTVTKCYPLVNELASPTRYLSESRSILAADNDIRRCGLEAVAVYHSHPTSAPLPSQTDLAENYYLGDGGVHVIISLTTQPPTTRAWRLFETTCEEVDLELVG